MSIKKTIMAFVLLISILITGCSKQVYIDDEVKNSLNYIFKIPNLNNIDKTLSNQKYAYSIKDGKEYISVITCQARNASIKQYLVNYTDTLSLAISKDTLLILSFHANSILPSTWNIENNIDNGILKFNKKSSIEIPLPNADKGKDGVNYNRQNFYFTPLKAGSEKVFIAYERIFSEEKQLYIKLTFDITIK